jgi:hypothetical protein
MDYPPPPRSRPFLIFTEGKKWNLFLSQPTHKNSISIHQESFFEIAHSYALLKAGKFANGLVFLQTTKKTRVLFEDQWISTIVNISVLRVRADK